MSENWWANTRWVVRDVGDDQALKIGLSPILRVGDEYWLEPNTASGNPLFYWIRFDDYSGYRQCWENKYFYPVGATPYAVPTMSNWDPNNENTKAEYRAEARQVRVAASNPYTFKLQGLILVNGQWEHTRLLFFRGVQQNGRDWAVIDVLMTSTLDEDGTAHGDPK